MWITRMYSGSKEDLNNSPGGNCWKINVPMEDEIEYAELFARKRGYDHTHLRPSQNYGSDIVFARKIGDDEEKLMIQYDSTINRWEERAGKRLE